MSGPLHRPYPPDRYRGTVGEVSAWFRASDTEPDIAYRSGGTCEYLATGDRKKPVPRRERRVMPFALPVALATWTVLVLAWPKLF